MGIIKHLKTKRGKKKKKELRKKMSFHEGQMYKEKAISPNWNSDASNYTEHKKLYDKYYRQLRELK